QPLWANSVKRLGVGTMRRFSKSTAETMRADLRSVLSPTCIARAQTTAALMTPPDRSLATAARLLEQAATEH
ncbi:MAG: hypothetical protein WBC17_09735, partial [Mycobacterium sp.]